jgi:hypothetical protein
MQHLPYRHIQHRHVAKQKLLTLILWRADSLAPQIRRMFNTGICVNVHRLVPEKARWENRQSYEGRLIMVEGEDVGR